MATKIKRNDPKFRMPLTQGTDDFSHLEITVHYSKPTTNWYSGGTSPQGMFLHVTPIKVTEMGFETILGRGHKKLLESAPRLNHNRVVFLFNQAVAQMEKREGAAWDLAQLVAANEGLVI